MTTPRRRVSPRATGYIAAAVLAVLGMVAIGLGWRGAARTLLVGEQLPWIVSGALTGVCLIACGAVIAATTQVRQTAANERRHIDRAIAEADALLDAMSPRR